MCSCNEISFGSVDDILTVSSINEVPQDITLPRLLNESLSVVNNLTSKNEVELSLPPSSETKVKLTIPASSDTEVEYTHQSSETEAKFTTPTSSRIKVDNITPSSSESEVKFIAPNFSNSEVERNATPSSKSVTKSLNLNAPFASEDIRYKKTGIKTPISPKGAVKKKV